MGSVSQNDEEPITLSTPSYFALVGVLLILGVLPLFWWSAEQGILAWNDAELRWSALRKEPLTGAAPLHGEESSVSIHRILCYGTCPIYSLTLYASGRVDYEGEGYVCKIGKVTAQVDARAAAKLIHDLALTGYFKIDWHPGTLIPDNPTVVSRLRHEGREREITHDHGDDGAPRLMKWMEEAIDEVSGAARWMPIRERRKRYCLEADGSKGEVPSPQWDRLSAPNHFAAVVEPQRAGGR